MPFQLTIDGLPLKVEAKEIPYGEIGKPGSILDIVLGHGVRLSHSCGGVGNCTTCHVYVHQGLEGCSSITVAEKVRLQEVYGLQPNSRLACQCVPNGKQDLVVEIP